MNFIKSNKRKTLDISIHNYVYIYISNTYQLPIFKSFSPFYMVLFSV